ncbi:MAG: GntR family transcriptional regulator [Planctomycetota bacterium]|nr:MAG: GntR family transcriptional regulator [Planctomycetota bacterium]
MFIRIESSSAVPIYRQIIDQIKYQIASGGLRVGDRLPSVRELARQLPVNQNTVLKAYDLLAREGLLNRRQGDGTFVEDAPPALKKSERIKQLSAVLAQVAAQAVHFEITPDQLHDLLDRQIKTLSQGDQHNE